MGRSLLIMTLVGVLLIGSPAAQEASAPDDMEFIEFLGTFEKDVDPMMLSDTPDLKKAPPKSPQKGSYGRKNTKQEGGSDE